MLYFLPYLILYTCAFSNFWGRGINFDGTLYAAISRNLALSPPGSFWLLPKDGIELFYEHPPLGFWVQSLFFKIFGDHRYTEKIYIVSVGICLLFLVGKMWDILTEKPELKWSPQLFLVLCPNFCSILKNNWLEVPMMIFLCLSTISILFAYKNNKKSSAIYASLSAGFFALCAILTKPPIPFALFASSFFLYFIFFAHVQKDIFKYALLFLIPFCAFAIYVYFTPEASQFIEIYTRNQLMASLHGQREISSPYYHVFKNFIDFLPPVLSFIFIFIFTQSSRWTPWSSHGVTAASHGVTLWLKPKFSKAAGIFLLCALTYIAFYLFVQRRRSGAPCTLRLWRYTSAVATLYERKGKML